MLGSLSFSDLDYIVHHWSKKVKVKFDYSQIVQNQIFNSNIEKSFDRFSLSKDDKMQLFEIVSEHRQAPFPTKSKLQREHPRLALLDQKSIYNHWINAVLSVLL